MVPAMEDLIADPDTIRSCSRLPMATCIFMWLCSGTAICTSEKALWRRSYLILIIKSQIACLSMGNFILIKC